MGNMSGGEGDVGGLRSKGSQVIHKQHNSMQGKSCLRVTPTPPFIAFLSIFRVLSHWSGLLLARIFHLLQIVRCSTSLNGSNPEQMKDKG